MLVHLLFLLFNSSAAQLYQSQSTSVRTPRISYITKSLNADIGSSIELECSVQHSRDYPILWVKKDGGGHARDLPISSNSALIIRDSRYALRHERDSTTYILQIKDLQEHDAGIYMCQVIIDRKNRISEYLTLVVRQPPFIINNSTRNVIAMQGTLVKLECYAKGSPAPNISWRKEYDAILPTGGSVFSGTELLIPSISKKDRGTYYCIADNGVGSSVKRKINVEVEFKPVVRIVKSLGKTEKFDALLRCRIESYPSADVNWIFRGESIVNNKNSRINKYRIDEDVSDSVLTLFDIEPRMSGNYTCIAKNLLGWASTQVTLKTSAISSSTASISTTSVPWNTPMEYTMGPPVPTTIPPKKATMAQVIALLTQTNERIEGLSTRMELRIDDLSNKMDAIFNSLTLAQREIKEFRTNLPACDCC